MPDPQVNPPDPNTAPQPPANPSKFRLSGLLGAMNPGSQSRGFPNLAGGASYLFSPQQREMFGNTQDTGVQQSRSGLMQSSALTDYLKTHYNDIYSTNPEVALAIAHAHGAGAQAALQATEAGAAARTEGETATAHQDFANRKGQSPTMMSLMQGADEGTAKVQRAQEEAGMGGAVTPEIKTEQERIRTQKELAGSELGEKHLEFLRTLPVDVLKAISGYGGIGMMGGPGGMKDLGNIFRGALKGAGLDTGGGEPTGATNNPAMDIKARFDQSRSIPTTSPKSLVGAALRLPTPTRQAPTPTNFSRPDWQQGPTGAMIGKQFDALNPNSIFSQLTKSHTLSPDDARYLADRIELLPRDKAKAMLQQLLQRNK